MSASSPVRASGPIALAILLAAPAVAAEPDPPDRVSVVNPRPARPTKEDVVPEPAPVERPAGEPTAADVASDPLPGFENGRADPVDDGDSTWRAIGRGALVVPRLAIDAALTPLRTVLWANERYHLTAWYRRVFFNDAETIGLYPTLAVDSALGVSAGARFVDHDLFGAREDLSVQAAAGSRYRQIYSTSLSSGKRLGDRFSLSLDAGYERRPHDAFYGIGNGDRVTAPAAAPGAPIDPRIDSTALEAHYRQDRARVAVTGDLKIADHLHVRPAGALSEVQFGNGDEGEPIDMQYDPRGLVGWGGIQYGYGELELRWDSRREATVMEPRSVYATGGLAAVFTGRLHRLDDGPDFWRYGVDLERFLRIADGPRVLIGHFHGEAVTGGRDEVPFTELPQLGGPTYLRGYALDQFRDRVAAFGSVAYEWDLSQWFSATMFVDAGRVYPALDELSLDHLRVGYGVSLEAHSVDAFVLEGSLGSSIDGGLFLNLSFNPVHDLDERVRRR
ncbi:MAG TPA: BamA/TamA family outer membrane protein [Kofleriaceae bacterium]|nr:BamA/TamA family outer membrane protein [Kofleriaceae bacterium]